MTEREQFIAIVDNDVLYPSDVIVMLEGDGYYRVGKAAGLYKKGIAPKVVFSGGITDYEYGSYPFSDVLPQLLEAGIKENDLIHENKSLNTREQAVEIVNMAVANGWKRIALVASHEHQYRAYLTFLRVVLDTKCGIILYNTPARNLGWFEESNWGIRFDRLTQEFLRIEKYSSLGHLASFSEAIDYQKWKEQQQ